MLDELGLAFLKHQHRLLASAEGDDLFRDQRIGHVQAVDRQFAVAIGVGQAQQLLRAIQVVVEAALDDDADVAFFGAEQFVQMVVADEGDARRPTLLDLLDFVQEVGGRQDDAVQVARRGGGRFRHGQGRAAVVAGGELAGHVAGADPQLQHDGGVGGLRQFEPLLHHVDDAGQIGARVQQPHLRLHGEGVGALLHDRGAFAIVLADDDQGAALHAARRHVRQGVRGDIGADHRFPGHGAAQRIVHRGGQHGGGGGLRRAGLKVDAQAFEQIVRVGEDVHQVADGRTLIAADIGHAGLQQGLCDGQDAFAPEGFPFRGGQLQDLGLERTLGHDFRLRRAPERAKDCPTRRGSSTAAR